MSVMKKLLGTARWTAFTGLLHVGIDLVSQPPTLTMIDDVNLKVHERRELPRTATELIDLLQQSRHIIADVVVLARADGYRLVDRLVAAGFRAHLLTPAELRRFRSLKNTGERHDAFWMAHLLRAGALPDGVVYSEREVTDTRHYPTGYRSYLAPLSTRLRVDRPRALELSPRQRKT